MVAAHPETFFSRQWDKSEAGSLCICQFLVCWSVVTVNERSREEQGGGERRREEERGGRRRGAARSCWQVDELWAVRGAEASSGCCFTGDPHLRLDRSSSKTCNRLNIHNFFPAPPPFLQEHWKKSSTFLFFEFPFLGWGFFPYRWRDLKMALHGLTLRKAEADLFDCCWFVTVEAALSDWTLSPFSSWSFFSFFLRISRRFSQKTEARYLD